MNNVETISIKNIKPNNTDLKPSIMDEISTISEVRNSYINKENKFSSEKNDSFISDTNSNNINKFLINDITNLEQNDKIIKELASELEQTSAKKDKLDNKLKTACNNIAPINLLSKKNENKNIEIIESTNNNPIKMNENNDLNNLNQKHISSKIIEYNSNINNINNTNNDKNKKEILNKVNVNIIENTTSENDNINEPSKKEQISVNNPNNSVNNNINNNISNLKGNNNINDMNNSNVIKNESISNLNPIKINNEIHLNEVISSNSVNKKLHAFDQKLLNLELYTKEKIIELISQINSLKQNNNNSNNSNNNIINNNINSNNINNNYKPLEKGSNTFETINKLSLVKTITPSSNEKYKTFNNSFISNQNQNQNQNQKLTQQNYYSIERMNESEQIQQINNENNKNLLNMSNNQQQNLNILFNNLDKKRYPLRNINTKQALINSKIQRKNSISYNLNSNKKFISNVLTENSSLNNNNINSINNAFNNNNNNFIYNVNSIIKNNNTKDIIEGTGTKIIHNINNDINAKFLKDTEKKMESNNILKVSNIDDLYSKKNNKSINYAQSRNNFGDASFNGTEIKLVDLNKLVNHQLPRNRLIPIHIND